MSDLFPQLETPAALVDLDRLDRNLDRVADYATSHLLALRPHIKTHKSTHVAAEQLRRGAVGVTCATPFEAEVMGAVCDDILVAYPPVGAMRAQRLLQLPDSVRLTVALDSPRAVEDLAAAARAAGRPVRVLVELDLGMHRVGLSDADAAIHLARTISHSAPLAFAGIAFYPGHIRQHVDAQHPGLAEMTRALATVISSFTDAGFPPAVVSGGSTPTLWRTHQLQGVTEFRPGTYVYNDRTTAVIGACDWSDCALTVLSTVISTAVPGQAVIDAGTKSLGREPIRGTDTSDGFGALLDRPEVIVKGMSEEHGILDLSRTDWRPEVGERVRVVPNHVCIVVHLNDLVYGVRGDVLETSWAVEARGRGQELAVAMTDD